MKISREKFDVLNGEEITAFKMKNTQGLEVTAIDYGCIITNILAPDKKGNIESVVLGFDTIQEYLDHSPYFGSVVGRFAGRIKAGKFSLNGENYELVKNNGNNHLHGGMVGLDKVIWDAETFESDYEVGVIFKYLSPDQEEGYPGNVHFKVKYTLNNKNEFLLEYEGASDKKTILNLTNHTYFNLSGNLKQDILSHNLTIKCDKFVELDEEIMPTGNILDVDGTVFDFRNGRKVKDGSTSDDTQNIIAGKGYDHPFILSENKNKEIILKDCESGRVLVIETNQSGVVLYTGTQLADDFSIRGTKSRKALGLCLETQGLPDAINQPSFPSCVVEKGEIYHAYTKWTFICENS